MDIGAMSMSMKQAALGDAVSVSVLKIAMSSEEQQKIQMTNMINDVDVTGKGRNINARV